MGAKTALLAFTDGGLPPALLGAICSDQAEAEDLVRQVHPGYDVAPIGDGTLFDSTYPPDDVTYATVLAGADLLCDQTAGRLNRKQIGVPSPESDFAAKDRDHTRSGQRQKIRLVGDQPVQLSLSRVLTRRQQAPAAGRGV